MCEAQSIRYVHYMSHGDLRLGVGCVCAGYMEGYSDSPEEASQRIASARSWQSRLINQSRRRERLSERTWGTLARGNPFLDVGERRLIIHNENQIDGSQKYFPTLNGHRALGMDISFGTIEEAQEAALRLLIPARVRLDFGSDSEE